MSLKDTFDKKCMTCKHYSIDESYKKSNRKGYACDYFTFHYAFHESCKGHYEYDDSRTEEDIEKAIKERVKYGYDGELEHGLWFW